LWEGVIVVFHRLLTEPVEGEVFVCNYEGEIVIKRLHRNEGEWYLTSDNEDQRRYQPKNCTEQCKILGRVVLKISEVV